MKIGELAKRSGLPPSTIRFYEAKGLLNAVSRQANGYREYPPEAVGVLQIIANAQQTGFSLDEIKPFLPDDATPWQHEELMSVLQKKIEDIEAMEARLAQSKASLRMLAGLIGNKPEGMDCQDHADSVMSMLGIARGQKKT